jgi:hypothetical protein
MKTPQAPDDTSPVFRILGATGGIGSALSHRLAHGGSRLVMGNGASIERGWRDVIGATPGRGVNCAGTHRKRKADKASLSVWLCYADV